VDWGTIIVTFGPLVAWAIAAAWALRHRRRKGN
jgi:uncharacterized membrane protein